MSPIRILLIDDDEDDFILTRELFKESLNSSNYQLSWCNNYLEAINIMLKDQYDIFLVDYRLGKHSGIDLLNEAVKSNCDKPIIILTGKGDSRIDEEAAKLGAADYLIKDEINSCDLERAIRYAIEHHKTLKKLKESENKFRIIFERSKDPMLISDVKGHIYESNTAALEFFEIEKEAFLKKNASDLYKNKSCRKDFISKMQQSGSVTDMDCDYVTFKGNVKKGSITSFVQISQHGNQELYYTILRDLTHKKIQEQQLVLEQKLAAIERVAKNMALEIYNPLTNINLAVDELKTSLNKPEEAGILEIIKKNCERIDQLTTELIASTQQSAIKIKKTNLSKLIKTAVEEAENNYNLEIVSNVEDTVWLHVDENELGIVFKNIFQNAAEAVFEGKGRVLLDVKQKPDEVILEILDNGLGIPEEHLDKIFEPFFTTKPKASGLGLTHSQRIIKAHNGNLEVNSGSTEGTRILITLPMHTN